MSDKATKVVTELATEEKRRVLPNGVILSSLGVRIKLKPLSPGILQRARAKIKTPPVPKYFDENKGREIENPNHPAYKAALEQVEMDRNEAVVNAMVMFGTELVDGVPEDDSWIDMLEVSGVEDNVNRDSKVLLEFLYKKHIAVGNPEYLLISQLSGGDPEAIKEQLDNFRD